MTDIKGRSPRDPNPWYRGSKRFGDLGRHAPPGDELENTRDHERIWAELDANRASKGGGGDSGPIDWQTPTLINSWVNAGAPFEDIAYGIDGDFLCFKGHIGGGASGTIAFYLDSAYWPDDDLSAITDVSSASGLGDAQIYVVAATGAVKVTYISAVGPGTGGSTLVGIDTIWDLKGDLAVATGPDVAVRLAVGTNGQVLTADSAQATGMKWATPSGGSGAVATDTLWDTKGDLAAATGPDAAVKVPVGTTGQVLTADPAQAAGMMWATPSVGVGGGALVLLEQHDCTGLATADFTSFISSLYDEYMIDFVNVVPATASGALFMRMGTGSGPTYDSGTNYGWIERGMRIGGTDTTQGATSGSNVIQLAGNGVGVQNNPLYGVSGSIRLVNPQSTSVYKQVYGNTVWFNASSTDQVISTVMAIYKVTTALTAVRFYFTAGNITSGKIRVYGIAK